MFSLQRLLGKDDRIFELLEDSARQAQISGHALFKFLQNPRATDTMEDFVMAARAENRIRADINQALSASFSTPLEPEDIVALSVVLSRIPKTVQTIAERILSATHLVQDVALDRQVVNLGKATDTVLMMIQELRKGSKLGKIKVQNDQLQAIEGEADQIMNDLLRELYTGSFPPLKVVFLKEIFELLEKVVDRCRDAGNVINQIVIKNS